MGTPEYYTIAEVAQRLRVSKMTCYRMANLDQLPGVVRFGPRLFRVRATTFDLWLAEQDEPQPAETA